MDRQTPMDGFWRHRSWVLGLGPWAHPSPKTQDPRSNTRTGCCRLAGPIAARPAGFSLVELTVTLTVVGILVTMSVPFYQRAIQQARTNVAATNLRAIWAAQRIYWMEYQAYARDLPLLKSQGILDPKFDDSDTAFAYLPLTSSDGFVLHFQATATPKNGTWTGQYTLDETGKIDGAIRPPDWSDAILPPEFP